MSPRLRSLVLEALPYLDDSPGLAGAIRAELAREGRDPAPPEAHPHCAGCELPATIGRVCETCPLRSES